jgi:predicted DNA-binding protein (MmcQ/YjbR family)
MSDAAQKLRSICLALPEAIEIGMRCGPSYRIEDKIFANERVVDGRLSVWGKTPPGSQAMLLADPERFFSPPYYGVKRWVGMRLDEAPDWNEVAAFVKRSYRLVAPKRLSAIE